MSHLDCSVMRVYEACRPSLAHCSRSGEVEDLSRVRSRGASRVVGISQTACTHALFQNPGMCPRVMNEKSRPASSLVYVRGSLTLARPLGYIPAGLSKTRVAAVR